MSKNSRKETMILRTWGVAIAGALAALGYVINTQRGIVVILGAGAAAGALVGGSWRYASKLDHRDSD